MLRRCLLLPIHEHVLAADLLSRAADALLEHDLPLAGNLLRESDLKPLEDYRYALAGPINPAIHLQTSSPVFPRVDKKRGPRMPTLEIEKQVMTRDGYRCRFCGSRVIVKETRKAFVRALPTVARWGRTNGECHFGLAVLAASIDHLVPFQRGGSNDLDNLVTTCNPCQFGRGHWLLDEVELEDPRSYPPSVDGWDGITRLRGV
jgi:5-methylcytosine-specific restriction endonuclease McrA